MFCDVVAGALDASDTGASSSVGEALLEQLRTARDLLCRGDGSICHFIDISGVDQLVDWNVEELSPACKLSAHTLTLVSYIAGYRQVVEVKGDPVLDIVVGSAELLPLDAMPLLLCVLSELENESNYDNVAASRLLGLRSELLSQIAKMAAAEIMLCKFCHLASGAAREQLSAAAIPLLGDHYKLEALKEVKYAKRILSHSTSRLPITDKFLFDAIHRLKQ